MGLRTFVLDAGLQGHRPPLRIDGRDVAVVDPVADGLYDALVVPKEGRREVVIAEHLGRDANGVTVTGTVRADPSHYARPVGAHHSRSITF